MEEEIIRLRELISQKDDEISNLKSSLSSKSINEITIETDCAISTRLSQTEIIRYSRQLLLPEIGMSGQIQLKKTSVLVVGAGGLGCPVAIYLCAAGIGKIGIVDHDCVELNNLHRQIAHNVETVGFKKSESLKHTLKKINPDINCTAYSVLLSSSNIESIIKSYDIIVDASDNVPTRYLLNDASVIYNKVLVSGSALRFEGQLTTYHYSNGPCYRCLFPVPPSSDYVTNCSEGGVLGAVTGVIGSLQALEVIKIATNLIPSYFKKMLLFDGLSGDIKTIRLRNRKVDCEICGEIPTVTKMIDYEIFCNAQATDKDMNLSLLFKNERISCSEYQNILKNEISHILLDVRSKNEFEICNLPNCVNIPIRELSSKQSLQILEDLILKKNSNDNFVVCRRGNDSQKAVRILQKTFPNCSWRDITGGLHAWHNEIDLNFPVY